MQSRLVKHQILLVKFINMILKISIEKGEDGFFVASVPSLKGCWSQGKTREEALANIREAIELYLEPDEIETTKRGREIVELAI